MKMKAILISALFALPGRILSSGGDYRVQAFFVGRQTHLRADYGGADAPARARSRRLHGGHPDQERQPTYNL